MQGHNSMKVGYAMYNKAICKKCTTNIARHIIKVGISKLQGGKILIDHRYLKRGMVSLLMHCRITRRGKNIKGLIN